MDEKRYLVPRRIDLPPRFLMWDMDVMLVFSVFFVLGMAMGHGLIGCGMGVLVSAVFGKLRAGKHPAFGVHWLYWHLPTRLGFRRLPHSYVREFVG